MLRWKGKKAPVPVSPPEWLIVGLGNPGPEYRWTRHNIGFDLIDKLADNIHASSAQGKHKALSRLGEIKGVSVVLIKPMTYMNESGQSVARWVKEFGLKPNHILVVSDDIHLDVGVLRLREKGSAGGHNGLKSIEAHLATNEYNRLRIGVGKPAGNQIDYVLGRFNKQESEAIEAALQTGIEVVEQLLLNGVSRAQEFIAQANVK